MICSEVSRRPCNGLLTEASSDMTETKKVGLLLLPLLLYLSVQSTFPDIERSLYWGEGTLLLILLVGVGTRFSFSPRYAQSLYFMIYLCFLLPIIGLAEGVANPEFSWAFVARHFAYFAYGLFFFVGFRHAGRIVELLSRSYMLLLNALLLVAQALTAPGLGASVLIGMLMLGLSVHLKGVPFWIMLLGFPWLLLMVFPSSTSAVIVVAVLSSAAYLWWLRDRPYTGLRKRIILLGKVGLLSVAIAYAGMAAYAIEKQMTRATSFAQIHSDYASIGDVNSVWRLAWWGIILSQFKEHPFGIGVGTPIVPVGSVKALTLGNVKTRSVAEYVVGPHNGFITYTIRGGLFFLVPFLLFFIRVVRVNVTRTFLVPFRLGNSGKAVFVSFIFALMVLVDANFNVMLESPRFAAGMWLAVGIWLRLSSDIELVRNGLEEICHAKE